MPLTFPQDCPAAARGAIDAIWIEAAARLGIPVARGGDAYVHFDGAVLHVADGAALDADDSLAQLVLHEICHALVEGDQARALPDWGLDNTNDGDLAREEAAVRLQAHLAGAYGLRGALYPTTAVRPFYEALGRDTLAASVLARQAAARAARMPWSRVLADALGATSRAIEQAMPAALGPRHPVSGWPTAVQLLKTCGDCAWRTPGGRCRQAPTHARVTASAGACVRWEAILDCAGCAACCRGAYGSVPVPPRDRGRPALAKLLVRRAGYVELARESDRCAALDGAAEGPFACRVYSDRPRPCRDFEIGGRHCLEARRRIGLTA
jgi:hypothetical protein